jgi:hypothetical protein
MSIKTQLTTSWKSLPFKTHILLAVIFSAVSALVIVLIRDFIPPVVPFFYGEAVGERQLTTSTGLLIAPALSILVVLVNSILAALTDNIFFKKILVAGSLLFFLLMTTTTIKIILLVGFF